MIFAHGTIVTMNPNREIIEDGTVVVSGDRIEAVGKTAALKSHYPDATEIDLTDHIVMPGLVDTHVHLAQTMLTGVVGSPPLRRLTRRADQAAMG